MKRTAILCFDQVMNEATLPDCMGLFEHPNLKEQAAGQVSRYTSLPNVNELEWEIGTDRDGVRTEVLLCLSSFGGNAHLMMDLIEVIRLRGETRLTNAVVGTHAFSAASTLMLCATDFLHRTALRDGQLGWHSMSARVGSLVLQGLDGGLSAALILGELSHQVNLLPHATNQSHPFLLELRSQSRSVQSGSNAFSISVPTRDVSILPESDDTDEMAERRMTNPPIIGRGLMDNHDQVRARLIKLVTGGWPKDHDTDCAHAVLEASPMGRFINGIALSETLGARLGKRIAIEGVGNIDQRFLINAVEDQTEVLTSEQKLDLACALAACEGYQERMKLCTNEDGALDELLGASTH